VRANNGSPRLERLDVGGIPIGLLPIARYEQESVALERGDTLVCYSDGISETMDAAGEIWSEAILEEIILRHLTRPANEMIDAIIRAADEYAAGAEQHDDMTIVVLRVL
jgi:sigma-B regulation protein RsbU (phosphoserine phosphatase)